LGHPALLAIQFWGLLVDEVMTVLDSSFDSAMANKNFERA
jgi:hypothetical protein